MLCQFCESLELKWLPNYEGCVEFQSSWSDIIRSARDGCELCSLAERELRFRHTGTDPWEPPYGPVNICIEPDYILYKGKNLLCKDKDNKLEIGPFFLVKTNQGRTPSRTDPPRQLVAKSAEADQCFDWASERLKACLGGRHKCKPLLKAVDPLPTRVLDLELYDGGYDLRLFESHRELEFYATLSHCWGSVKPFMTELATLPERLERISFLDLPPAFHDAVRICRKFEIRYLWIDTLCIIQDSQEDWARESAQMSRIYKNGMIMIAFSDYQDCHQAILCERTEVQTCKLGRNFADTYVQAYFTRDTPNGTRSKTTLYSDPRDTLERTRLNRRAWCFQERLLAPRIIHYTSGQLIWECLSALETESGVASSNITPLKKSLVDVKRPSSFSIHWPSLIEAYSQCNITFLSDRLPALSGVASGFQKSTSDMYLAGLWKNDLHKGLLWISCKISSPTAEYCAPSWSWASFTGAVKLAKYLCCGLRITHDHNAIFLDHKVHLITSDPLGRIDAASLLIQGYCARLEALSLTIDTEVFTRLQEEEKAKANGEWYNYYWLKDAQTVITAQTKTGNDYLGDSPNNSVFFSRPQGSFHGSFDNIATLKLRETNRYILLQIGRWKSHSSIPGGGRNIVFNLLLERIDEKGGYWRRARIVQMYPVHELELKWEAKRLTLV
jgi:hypothetical protein